MLSKSPSHQTNGLGHRPLPSHTRLVPAWAERRRKLRMRCAYAATVRGRDLSGGIFEIEAVLDNLSACGLRLRLQGLVLRDTRLFILAQFSSPSPNKSTRLVQGIAVRGVVQRLELLPAGMCALGVEFSRYRFVDIPNEQAALLRSLRHPCFD